MKIMNILVKFFHRWVNCTRGVHCAVTHHDDRGVCGAYTCNICNEYHPAIVWPRM